MAEIKIAGAGKTGLHPRIVSFLPVGPTKPRVGLILNTDEDTPKELITDLNEVGIRNLTEVLRQNDPVDFIRSRVASQQALLAQHVYDPNLITIHAPVDRDSLNFEVWCAGVTYDDSKRNRNLESNVSPDTLSDYDKVYVDPRPELFFKATPRRVNGPNKFVNLRFDSKWMVPEPEFTLVVNPGGKVIGLTICNDQSSRDIEGANKLYLPQAKIFTGGCAVGPGIALDYSEADARQLEISMEIIRNGQQVFEGKTTYGKMKEERTFENLTDYLFRENEFPDGVFLSTGTGIIPPPDFTLQMGDVIRITADGIGTLENVVGKPSRRPSRELEC